ncbi:hypothetical protein CYY_007919 [Polysphondylium violaceum]|uniref:Peptidase A1 domain-containing protein n=1 Tax=Polysphondylium violaceum TaxID=133409 RepID=A0A8J4UQJ2_9MYCE|nr:hypothetical protein CYY_007919 [Polysphondylium violaceum]
MGNSRFIVLFLLTVLVNIVLTLDHSTKHPTIEHKPAIKQSLVLSGKSEFLSSSIQIGPDSYPVIIDSTVNYLFVAGKKCESCTLYPPYYKESPVAETIQCDSPTCHSNGNICERISKIDPPSCGLATNLSNGATIRASLYKDFISIDDNKNIPVIIASIYKQEGGPNFNQAILGVGPSCPLCPTTPLQTLLKVLKKPYIFGVSLDKAYFGGISIGMVDPLLYTGGINYTAMSSDDNLYSITPKRVGSYWNGQILKITTEINRFVVKTSSSISYFPTAAYNLLKGFLINGCKDDIDFCPKINDLFSTCLNATDIEIDRFPSLQISFEGFSLVIPPKIYFHAISKDNQVYSCLGIQESPDQDAVFGVNLMRELYTVFDNENQRIGFGRK